MAGWLSQSATLSQSAHDCRPVSDHVREVDQRFPGQFMNLARLIRAALREQHGIGFGLSSRVVNH